MKNIFKKYIDNSFEEISSEDISFDLKIKKSKEELKDLLESGYSKEFLEDLLKYESFKMDIFLKKICLNYLDNI